MYLLNLGIAFIAGSRSLSNGLLRVVIDLLYEWLLILTKSSSYTLTYGVHQVYHKAKT